jgi:hypothetical protein
MNRREEDADSPALAPGGSRLSLSLVIPAYNEGYRLAAGFSRLRDAVASGAIDPRSTEFVVVDDGSTDDTSEQAAALFAPFPHVRLIRLPENQGKGAAVRAGVAVASAPSIAFADADMAIDPAQTPRFQSALGGADLAIGSRAAYGASVDRSSFRRSMMNRIFSKLVNALTSVSLNDTQCGYKAFRAPAAKLLFHCTVTERFAFDVEILALARRLGLPIAEVPVRWLRVKGSRIRPWSDARSMTRDVLRAGRGAASVPAVPALAVTFPDRRGPDASSSLEALRRGLAPWLPVLPRGDRGILVLCPMMDELKVAETAASVSARYDGAVLERSAVTLAQLCSMAPLALAWREDAAGVDVPPTPPTLAAGKS